MTPIVHTHISGATCVVQMDPHWELYIEAKDGSYANHDLVEVVHRGQVNDRYYVINKSAPYFIVGLMKSLTKQFGLYLTKEPK